MYEFGVGVDASRMEIYVKLQVSVWCSIVFEKYIMRYYKIYGVIAALL